MTPAFLYFLPGISDTAAAKKPASFGIGYAFDGPPVVAPVPGNGPSGGSGMLLWNRGTADVYGYYPDKQTWKRVPGSVAWLGWYTDAVPEPEHLGRKGALGGHAVELGDGNAWTCPAARHWEAGEAGTLVPAIAAPHSYVANDEGVWTIGEVVPRYAALWAVAQRYFDLMQGANDDGMDGFDFAGSNDAAIECIGTNYRIGKAEASALNLLNGGCVHQILEAAIDLPNFKALKKTTDTAGSNSSDGQAA